MAFLNELVHDTALIVDIHKNQKIGNQMSILNDFSLLVPGVFGNDALVPKSHKLNEVVKPFIYRCRMIDGSSKCWFA